MNNLKQHTSCDVPLNQSNNASNFVVISHGNDGGYVRIPKLPIQSILKERDDEYQREAQMRVLHVTDPSEADALAAEICGETTAATQAEEEDQGEMKTERVEIENLGKTSSERLRIKKSEHFKESRNMHLEPLTWHSKLQSQVLSWVGLDDFGGKDSALHLLYNLFYQGAHGSRFFNHFWWLECLSKLLLFLQLLGLFLEDSLARAWGPVTQNILYWYNIIVRSFGLELIPSNIIHITPSLTIMRTVPSPLFYLGTTFCMLLLLLTIVNWKNSRYSTLRTIHHTNQSLSTLREVAYTTFTDGSAIGLLIAISLLPALYVPCLSGFITTFVKCYWIYTDKTIISSPTEIAVIFIFAILSVFLAIWLIFITALYTTAFFEWRPSQSINSVSGATVVQDVSPYNLMGRSHSFLDLIIIGCTTILVGLNRFLALWYSNPTQQFGLDYLYVAIGLVISLTIFAFTLSLSPYYKMYMNRISTILSLILFSAAITALLSTCLNRNARSEIPIIVFASGAILISGIVGGILSSLRLDLVILKATLRNIDPNMKAFATAIDMEIASRVMKSSYSNIAYFQKLYSSNQIHFYNSTYYHICWATFVASQCQNPAMALGIVSSVEYHFMSLPMRIMHYIRREYWKRCIELFAHADAQKISLRKVQRYDQKTRRICLVLWDALSKVTTSNTLLSTGRERDAFVVSMSSAISRIQNRAKVVYQAIIDRYPTPYVYREYAKFMLQACNDPEKFEEYMNLANVMEINRAIENNASAEEIVDEEEQKRQEKMMSTIAMTQRNMINFNIKPKQSSARRDDNEDSTVDLSTESTEPSFPVAQTVTQQAQIEEPYFVNISSSQQPPVIGSNSLNPSMTMSLDLSALQSKDSNTPMIGKPLVSQVSTSSTFRKKPKLSDICSVDDRTGYSNYDVDVDEDSTDFTEEILEECMEPVVNNDNGTGVNELLNERVILKNIEEQNKPKTWLIILEIGFLVLTVTFIVALFILAIVDICSFLNTMSIFKGYTFTDVTMITKEANQFTLSAKIPFIVILIVLSVMLLVMFPILLSIPITIALHQVVENRFYALYLFNLLDTKMIEQVNVALQAREALNYEHDENTRNIADQQATQEVVDTLATNQLIMTQHKKGCCSSVPISLFYSLRVLFVTTFFIVIILLSVWILYGFHVPQYSAALSAITLANIRKEKSIAITTAITDLFNIRSGATSGDVPALQLSASNFLATTLSIHNALTNGDAKFGLQSTPLEAAQTQYATYLNMPLGVCVGDMCNTGYIWIQGFMDRANWLVNNSQVMPLDLVNSTYIEFVAYAAATKSVFEKLVVLHVEINHNQLFNFVTFIILFFVLSLPTTLYLYFSLFKPLLDLIVSETNCTKTILLLIPIQAAVKIPEIRTYLLYRKRIHNASEDIYYFSRPRNEDERKIANADEVSFMNMMFNTSSDPIILCTYYTDSRTYLISSMNKEAIRLFSCNDQNILLRRPLGVLFPNQEEKLHSLIRTGQFQKQSPEFVIKAMDGKDFPAVQLQVNSGELCGITTYMISCKLPSSAMILLQDIVQSTRAQVHHLTYKNIPPILTDLIAKGEKYAHVVVPNMTLVSIDLHRFGTLIEKMYNTEMLSLLEKLNHTFDTLALKHKMLKVTANGNSFLAVALPIDIAEPVYASTMSNKKTVETVNSENALLFCLAVLEKVKNLGSKLNLPLKARIGVHNGTCVLVATPNHIAGYKNYNLDVHGESARVAFEMQRTCEPNNIHVTMNIQVKCFHKFEFEALGKMNIESKGNVDEYTYYARSLLNKAVQREGKGSTGTSPATPVGLHNHNSSLIIGNAKLSPVLKRTSNATPPPPLPQMIVSGRKKKGALFEEELESLTDESV